MTPLLAQVYARRRVARDVRRRGRVARSSGRRVRTGGWPELFCDADVDEWKAKNRIPLYPGRWQAWVVWVSRADADTDPAALVTDALRYWFDFPIMGHDPIDGVKATAGVDPDALRGLELVRRREEATPMPLLKPGPVSQHTIRFVFRGTAADMPFPVFRSMTAYRGPIWCPLDADVIVDRVYTSPPDPVPPPPKTPWEKVADLPGDVVEAAKKGAKEAAKSPIAWVVGGIAVLFGVGYAVRAFR